MQEFLARLLLDQGFIAVGEGRKSHSLAPLNRRWTLMELCPPQVMSQIRQRRDTMVVRLSARVLRSKEPAKTLRGQRPR